ncbi:hypothetical protein [Aurantivibrio plasticivorans]
MRNPFINNEKNYWRVLILSSLGVYIFFLSKYIGYYLELLNSDERIVAIYQAAGFLSCLLLIIPYVIRKSVSYIAIVTLLFLFASASAILFDNVIKSRIAESAIYFNSFPAEPEGDVLIEHSFFGYSLELPTSWKAEIHPAGYPYFSSKISDGKKNVDVELRPSCFNVREVSAVDAMISIENSLAQGFILPRACFKNENIRACRAYFIEGGRPRLKWFIEPIQGSQGLALDVVGANDEIESEMLNSISILTFEELGQLEKNCSIPSSWM